MKPIPAKEMAPDFVQEVSFFARTPRYELVLYSALVWTAFYFVGKFILPYSSIYTRFNDDPKLQYRIRGLVPSTAFLSFIIPMAIYCLLYDTDLHTVRVAGKTDMSLWLVAVTTGYFVYDTFIVLFHINIDGPAYLVHGVVCTFTYGVSVVFECLQYYGIGFLLFESTTLFVSARWLLAELDMRNSQLYFINGCFLLGTWFLFRIVMGYTLSILYWFDAAEEYKNPQSGLPSGVFIWYCTSNIILTYLNTTWFLKIVKGSLKVLSEQGQKKSVE